jgi:uncharacterized protein
MDFLARSNLTQAQQYALDRLGCELPPTLTYHSILHTRDDVVPAAQRLAALEGVSGEALMLLTTAAYFHDLGYVEQYEDNEEIAVRMACAVLPGMGYTPLQIQVIGDLIMATRVPQSPHTRLAEILVDADLDSLGREDFLETSLALRTELESHGASLPLAVWYQRQLAFMQTHRYFTTAAQNLREAGKQANLARLSYLLAQIRPEITGKLGAKIVQQLTKMT